MAHPANRDELLAPYTKPNMLSQSPLFYFITIYKHMNAAFAQRSDALAHYYKCVDNANDLPSINIAFWHLNADGNIELIDYVLRDAN